MERRAGADHGGTGPGRGSVVPSFGRHHPAGSVGGRRLRVASWGRHGAVLLSKRRRHRPRSAVQVLRCALHRAALSGVRPARGGRAGRDWHRLELLPRPRYLRIRWRLPPSRRGVGRRNAVQPRPDFELGSVRRVADQSQGAPGRFGYSLPAGGEHGRNPVAAGRCARDRRRCPRPHLSSGRALVRVRSVVLSPPR